MRIAILHGPGASVSVPEILQACADEYKPVFLVTPDNAAGNQLINMISRVAEVRVTREANWVKEAERSAVAAATTFVDHYVTALEDVVDALGLRGSTSTQGCWDKLLQRELLNKAGASSVPILPVANFDDLIRAREVIGPAGILKPRLASTGRGIRIVRSGEQSSAVWNELTLLCCHRRISYIYEELMDEGGGDGWLAPFVSVDSVSWGGQRFHFGLFEKLPLLRGYIETGHIGPSALSSGERTLILSVAENALDALGVTDRVTHTEIRLTSAGPQVIEVNGRLGGYVQGLTASLTGTDAARIALDAAAGCQTAIPEPPDHGSADHAVAAFQIPLDTDSADLVSRTTRMLRLQPLVKSVEVPAAVNETLRYAGAWLEARTREELLTALTRAIGNLCQDPEVRAAIDPDWLRVVSAPPERLTTSTVHQDDSAT